jgi:hypothetical protein
MTKKKIKQEPKQQKKYPPEIIAEVGNLYRGGMITVPEISDRFDIKEATIRRWASKYKWKRDLRARIQQEAERIIEIGAVNEDAFVDQAANELASALSIHARVLAKNLRLIEQAQAQLMPETSADAVALADLPPEDEEKIPMGQRVAVMKMIVDAASKAIADQRKHYKMDNAEGGGWDTVHKAMAECQTLEKMP